MKKLICLSLAVLMVLLAVSCKKDNKPDNDNPASSLKEADFLLGEPPVFGVGTDLLLDFVHHFR